MNFRASLETVGSLINFHVHGKQTEAIKCQKIALTGDCNFFQAWLFINHSILTTQLIITNTFSCSFTGLTHFFISLCVLPAAACKSDTLKGLYRTLLSLSLLFCLTADDPLKLYTMSATLIAIPLCNYRLSCD